MFLSLRKLTHHPLARLHKMSRPDKYMPVYLYINNQRRFMLKMFRMWKKGQSRLLGSQITALQS